MGSGFVKRGVRAAGLCAAGLGLGAGAAVIALPTMAFATPASSLFYERTLMLEAGNRCHFFTPAISTALGASSLQARGAAQRAGIPGSALAATEERARTMAWTVACTSPDLTTAAGRVRDAFSGYAKLNEMSFPGDLGTWQAARKPRPLMANGKPVEGPRWRLSQAVHSMSGLVTFGMAQDSDIPVVTTTEPGALGASYAVLIVRDPAKAPEAYIDPRIGSLAGRVSPVSVTRSFFAQSRATAPITLSPNGSAKAAMFSFPPAAAKALERLDPREAVTIQLVYSGRGGERTSSALVEVGDFAAGRAFLAAR